jgi:hypothetical protein
MIIVSNGEHIRLSLHPLSPNEYDRYKDKGGNIVRRDIKVLV